MIDCVSVRYQTVVSVLTCILKCTVLSCFKLRRLIEKKVFYPQDGCGGCKISPLGTHTILETPPSPSEGGVSRIICVNFKNFAGLSGVFTLFSVSEERVPKLLKTDLNCRQETYLPHLLVIKFTPMWTNRIV